MGSVAALRLPAVPLVAALPVVVGLLAMYVPTFLDVSRVYWANERGSAGPMILAICAWLMWRVRERLLDAPDADAMPLAGSALMAVGLAMYAIGRSQDFARWGSAPSVDCVAPAMVAARTMVATVEVGAWEASAQNRVALPEVQQQCSSGDSEVRKRGAKDVHHRSTRCKREVNPRRTRGGPHVTHSRTASEQQVAAPAPQVVRK